jgi:hypothetical protein
MTSESIIHKGLHNQTSWLVHSAKTSHEHTRIHKIHHGLNLGEATTFPLIVLYGPSHGVYIQMSFCTKIPKLGVPKNFKIGTP